MLTNIRMTLRMALASCLSAAAMCGVAQAQISPSAFPVPFVTAYAGTGQVGTATCTTGIATTSGVSYGDGCLPATAGLAAPQGVAIDKYGNVYVADYTDRLVRVIYNGGASVAALITETNSGYAISSTRNAPAPTPVVGDIYTIAGIGGITALTATESSGAYACANYATSNQPAALNSLGDGCPAAAAPVGPRDVSLDANGNLFITDYTNSRIRVLCVNCASTTLAGQLIALEEPGVTPVNGAMYTIAGYAAGYRDGYIGYGNATTAATSVSLLRSPTAAVVSSSDDIYIADNLNNAVRLLYNGGTVAKNILKADGITPTLGYVYTIAGAGCVSAATNKTGSVASANSCLTTKGSDTPTLGNALGLNVSWTVYLDANNNLYYTDAGNARLKAIYGGISAPLTLSANTLQTGYAYTIAGGGTLSASGVAPTSLLLSSIQGVGGDGNGNIFFIDYGTGLFYETYAQSGLTTILGGGGTVKGALGTVCNGGTTGPAMSDAYFDGCPLTQAAIGSPRGPIVADGKGNLYFGDSPGSLVREFTYNPAFPTTTVGASSPAQGYAFTFSSNQTLATPTFTVDGANSAGLADAGGDTCTSGLAATAGSTCVVYAAFSPAAPGLIAGSVQLKNANGIIGSSSVAGIGTGAGVAVDPATETTVGTGLIANGIAVDGAGSVLIADGSSQKVLRYTAGVASTVAQGFSNPSGVAVDGAGNIFVSDSGANVVKEVPITGTEFILSSIVSNPNGLATDGYGNLYIADTGNNRILVYGPGATQPGVAAFTGLEAPTAVAVDSSGNLYAADSTHVVQVTPAGTETTVSNSSASAIAVDAAGNLIIASNSTLAELPAAGGASVPLSSALITPKAVALDSAGNAYVADSSVAGYIELQRSAGYYQFTSNPSSSTVYLSSVGNETLSAPAFAQTDTIDFSLQAPSNDGCTGPVVAGADCQMTAGFSPTAPGTLTDNVAIASNAVNSSSTTLTLTGTTAAQNTTTLLTESSTTSVYGVVQTLTATVTGSLSAPTAGTVNFYNNNTILLGSANVTSNGIATLNIAPPVGNYSVTATFVPTGLGFYGSSSTSKLFSVTPAQLTVTANNASRLFDTPNPSFTYQTTGFVNNDTQATATLGSPLESTTAMITSDTGTYPIIITQGTLSAVNYTFIFVNGTLTVSGATAQSILFGPLPNVTYGVSPITLTATSSSLLPISYSVIGPATVSGSLITIIGAGQVTVIASQNGNDTYAAAQPVSQQFTVSKALLTLNATSTSRLYGAANPTLTYTLAGFVNGDMQVTSTTGAPTESTSALPGSPIGPYTIAIQQGTLSSNNYTFNAINGTLTVMPAVLTLTANNASRLYGAANPVFSGSLSGAVNNDQLTETFSSVATASSAPGLYPIVPGAAGANVANYTFAATNGSLTINQATPSILLGTSATSGYQGYTNFALTATLGSPTTGAPTGTVTFMVGGNSVGSATISGSTASITTNSLPVGQDEVTAFYNGDTNFAVAVSSQVAINVGAPFSVSPSATTLSFPANYQEAQAFFTINPGGRPDTLTFACQNLPANLSCAFNPATLALSGLSTPQTIQLLVSDSSSAARLDSAPSRPLFAVNSIAIAALPFCALLLCGLRRRRLLMLIALAVATLGGAAVFSGCGGSAVSGSQGAGTYNFTVSINSGGTTLQTVPFTLTIP